MPNEFWLGMILGGLIQAVITILYMILFCGKGVFLVDKSDPEKDICRLVLDDAPSTSNKKWFVIKVDDKANLSQE